MPSVMRPALAALALLLCGVVWYWTPLREWLVPDRVAALAAPLRSGTAGPLLWAAVFTVAGLLMVPLSVLVVASALLFGPLLGSVVSFCAAVASSVGGYLLGRWLWRDAVQYFAGARLARISREIGKRGIVSMMAVRMVPIAPFTVVNMVAGATHVSLRDFTLGTAVGVIPGIAGLSIVADRAVAAVTEPNARSWAVLILIAAFFAATIMWLRRRFS